MLLNNPWSNPSSWKQASKWFNVDFVAWIGEMCIYAMVHYTIWNKVLNWPSHVMLRIGVCVRSRREEDPAASVKPYLSFCTRLLQDWRECRSLLFVRKMRFGYRILSDILILCILNKTIENLSIIDRFRVCWSILIFVSLLLLFAITSFVIFLNHFLLHNI